VARTVLPLGGDPEKLKKSVRLPGVGSVDVYFDRSSAAPSVGRPNAHSTKRANDACE
jgi:hypothetical protein